MNTNCRKSSSRNRVKKHRAIRKMCKTDMTEILHRVVCSATSNTKAGPKNEDTAEVSAIDDNDNNAQKDLMQESLQGVDVFSRSNMSIVTDIDTEMEINTQHENDPNTSDISIANDIDEVMRMDIQQEAELVHLENQTEPAYNSNKSVEPKENIVDELRQWAIESNIQQNHLDRLLKILRRELIPSLPKSSKTFLKTSSGAYCITEMEDADIMSNPGQFAYLGIEEGLKRCVNPNIHNGTFELIFNVDGLPISGSSENCFWPILCKTHYVPDIYSPFPVAIYLGMSKPKNLENYFKQFIQEINRLQEHGTVISGKRYEVKMKCFVADTPARAFLKSCKCHGGYNACERCVVHGQCQRTGKGWTMVYPGVNHQRRTDVSFRRQEDPARHTGISPLLDIKPDLDMVMLCLLDLMHLISGVTKKMIGFWMKGVKGVRPTVRLTPSQKKELSRRLISLRRQVPSEFQRKPRSILEVLQWKATEFRFFMLYCGPVVLKSILPPNLYQHFLLLHIALRILCSDELALSYNALAKKCLKKFVLALPLLYGPASVVINMHNLVHLVDDAMNMGCSLSRLNCFPFESALGAMKKKLRTPNKPLAQICRRYQEKNSLQRQQQLSLPPIIEVHNSCRKKGITIVRSLEFRSMFLSSVSPNNMVLLEDGVVMRIDKIWNRGPTLSSMMIQGKVWTGKKSLYDCPLNSRHFGTWELQKPFAVSVSYLLTKVKQKLVMMNLSFRRFGPKRLYIISMLHT